MSSATTASEDGTGLRATVASAARRFKSSWFELGRLLSQVRSSDAWQRWGFVSFEAYCTGELHIRRATAEKLLRSYGFLKRHEREAPETSERAPPFEVVTVLAEAEERGQLTEGDYARVRDTIWDPGRTPSELRRELTERFPAPERAHNAHSQLLRFARTARRLATELRASTQVPAAAKRTAQALADELESLAETR
ncbi:MAG: hypothetical protein ACLQDQ_06470 [Myxococcaceae bacterium]